MTDTSSPNGTTAKNFSQATKKLIAKKHAADDHSQCKRDCTTRYPPKASSSPPSANGNTPYGAKVLQDEYDILRTTAPGGRNDQLFKTATRLFELYAGGEIASESEVEQLLRDACMENRYLTDEPRAFDKSLKSARATGLANPQRAPMRDLITLQTAPAPPSPNGGASPKEETPSVAPEGSVLPEGFWEARPYLLHIRQAAWSRGRSAEAVLGAVLARYAAGTDHHWKLPAIVGSPCGLSFLTALVARSGVGKSNCSSIARELIPRRALPPECDGVPPGSGEGFIELLFNLESEVDPITNKATRVKRQTRYNAYMYIDEGEILSQMSNRNNGMTFWSVARTVFSDGVVGQSNASEDRKRILPAGNYVYGIVMGIQPEKSRALFDDATGGTPQRLVWMAVNTPSPAPGERPEWPETYPWPTLPHRPIDPFKGGFRFLEIAPEITEEIVWNDYKKSNEGCEELDSHSDLVKLKIAAILAVMAGRIDVNTEDWSLAGMVMAASTATRDWALRYLEKEKKQAVIAHGEKQSTVEEVLEQKRIERQEKVMHSVMKAMWNKLKQHQEGTEHAGGSCGKRCLTRAVAGKHRSKINTIGGVDEALERLIGMQWIKETEAGNYTLGGSGPRDA